jgi:hypothetical protein
METALAEMTRATGLQFEFEGNTDEQPSDQRSPIQISRYGNQWAPVLIAWTDPSGP